MPHFSPCPSHLSLCCLPPFCCYTFVPCRPALTDSYRLQTASSSLSTFFFFPVFPFVSNHFDLRSLWPLFTAGRPVDSRHPPADTQRHQRHGLARSLARLSTASALRHFKPPPSLRLPLPTKTFEISTAEPPPFFLLGFRFLFVSTTIATPGFDPSACLFVATLSSEVSFLLQASPSLTASSPRVTTIQDQLIQDKIHRHVQQPPPRQYANF